MEKRKKLSIDMFIILFKNPGLRQFLLTNLVEGEDGKYKWRVNLDSITSNFSTNISNFPNIKTTFDGPTLFIGGSNSDYLL